MLDNQARQYQIYSFHITVYFLVFIYLNHNKKMGVLFILIMIQAKFIAILMENYSFFYIILLENYSFLYNQNLYYIPNLYDNIIYLFITFITVYYNLNNKQNLKKIIKK